MIEEPPLLTIRKPTRRPTQAQIDAFAGVPTSVVSDALEGGGALASAIRHLDGGATLPPTACGPALTAGCGAADLLALLGALKFIQPGDMVVAAFEDHRKCAIFGDRLAGMMKNAGAAGAVTDGPVRDLDGILPVGLPVWCAGLAPASPFSNGPGTIGLPVQIGGQSVDTGDMVIADRDGVVIVPFERIDAVAARAAEIISLERALEADISGGLTIPEDIAELLESDRIRWVD